MKEKRILTTVLPILVLFLSGILAKPVQALDNPSNFLVQTVIHGIQLPSPGEYPDDSSLYITHYDVETPLSDIIINANYYDMDEQIYLDKSEAFVNGHHYRIDFMLTSESEFPSYVRFYSESKVRFEIDGEITPGETVTVTGAHKPRQSVAYPNPVYEAYTSCTVSYIHGTDGLCGLIPVDSFAHDLPLALQISNTQDFSDPQNTFTSASVKPEGMTDSFVSGIQTLWFLDDKKQNSNYTPDGAGNHSLYANIQIKAKPGLGFTKDTTFLFMGQALKPRSLSDGGATAYVYSPYFMLDCKHPFPEVSWTTDEQSGYRLCPNCQTHLYLHEHDFDEGTANGNEITYTCQTCPYQKTVMNTATLIDKLIFTDAPCIIGAALPSFNRLYGSGIDKAEITSQEWYEGTDTSGTPLPSDTIAEAKSYTTKLTIAKKGTYYFSTDNSSKPKVAPSTTASVNGNFDLTTVTVNSASEITVTATYKALSPGVMSVTLPRVSYGMTLGDVFQACLEGTQINGSQDMLSLFSISIQNKESGKSATSVTAHCTPGGDWTFDSRGGDWGLATLATPLTSDTNYLITLTPQTASTDYFFEDVTIQNASEPGYASSFFKSAGFKNSASVYACYRTGSSQISEVLLSGLTAPVIGESASSYATASGANGLSDISTQWQLYDHASSSWQDLTPSDTYTCAALYRARITAFAKSGFTFAEDASCVVEGLFQSVAVNHSSDTELEVLCSFAPLTHSLSAVSWQIKAKATPSANGVKERVCPSNAAHIETASIPRPAVIELTPGSYTYSASSCKPQVSVKDAAGAVIAPEHYSVSYDADTTSAGAHKVTVTFAGTSPLYSGTLTAEYTITEQKTAAGNGASGSNQNVSSDSGKQNPGITSAQVIKVKAKKASFKRKVLRRKKQTTRIQVTVSSGKTASLKYKNITKKKLKKYLKVSGKGKITLKKGAKKGTYKIRVTGVAKAGKGYPETKFNKVIKIKVK